MRRACALLVLLVLVSCTPDELARWSAWHDVDPIAADAYADDVLDELAYGRCGRWHDEALTAGFAESDWSTLSRLMWRESKCLPHVQNPSGATGLLQVMPMWADDCGTTPEALFDPNVNLTCARHVLDVQGWQAWSTY